MKRYLELLSQLDDAWLELSEEEQRGVEAQVGGREFVVDHLVAAIEVVGGGTRRRFELEPPVTVHKLVAFPSVTKEAP